MTFSSTREPATVSDSAATTTVVVMVAVQSITLSMLLPILASIPTSQPSNIRPWAVA